MIEHFNDEGEDSYQGTVYLDYIKKRGALFGL